MRFDRFHGDVRKTYADISKMKRLLKIKTFVSFEEGLKKTLSYFRSACAREKYEG